MVLEGEKEGGEAFRQMVSKEDQMICSFGGTSFVPYVKDSLAYLIICNPVAFALVIYTIYVL